MAPEDVRDDVETYGEGLRTMHTVLVTELESADIQAAGEAIDDHYRQEC